MDTAARQIIDRLELAPHPEGGWYRETWRADAEAGERAGGTAIHFLLEAGQRSHWHRVDAQELWFWHAGDPIHLLVEQADGVRTVLLGGDVAAACAPHALVPAHRWQSAEARSGWALASCVVVPGFDFAGFELAPDGWSPGAA